jgi:hypothetical protein
VGSKREQEHQALDRLARALPGWLFWKLRQATGWLVIGVAYLTSLCGFVVGIWLMTELLRRLLPADAWVALLLLALIVPSAFAGWIATLPIAWVLASGGAYLIDPEATNPEIAKLYFGSFPRLFVSRSGRLQMKAAFHEKNMERQREGRPPYRDIWRAWRE